MIDWETIIILAGTIVGSTVVSSLTNWLMQKHFISKLEKFMEKRRKKNGRR